MKKALLVMLVAVLITQLVNAAEVCVVVDYGGYGEEEPDSKCVDVDEGVDGYNVLEETGFDIEWSKYYNKTIWGIAYDYGHALCKIKDIGEEVDYSSGINGMGCKWDVEYEESFWNFNLVNNGKWGHMPVGYDGGNSCWNRDFSWDKLDVFVHYCAKDGDTISLAFGKAGAEPDMFKVNVTKASVDGKKQSESKTERGKIIDIFPGSVVGLKIELENLYDSSTDIEIGDISIEGTIEEINNGDDLTEEIQEFELGANRKTTKEMDFKIPLEAEAKDRLLKIELNAKDSAGIRYEKEVRYDLEIEREEHKLKIIKAELGKEAYKCGENALLDFSVINVGEKKENVKLEIGNKELGIDITEDFELFNDAFEESSKYENRFNIWLPVNISKATYPIIITANYGAEKETANVNLVVSECEKKEGSTQTKEVKESKEGIDVEAEKSDQKEGTGAEKETEPKETTEVEEKITKNLPFALIVVFGVLIVLIIALLVIFWVARR